MPLEARDNSFFLDGKKIRLLSGAVHYFRIVPEYWEDRLLRLKACGLNCVETYVPWNLHEQFRGQFSFDGILDIRRYLKLAQELKLHVILRPGPYICAEWDFGGLPSWLLRDPQMKVRSSYQPYLAAVERYLTELMTQVADLQNSRGGPIIAVQVENEYGSYGNDTVYKTQLTEMLRKLGVSELLFTSENGMGLQVGHIPGVLMTSNFQEKDHGLLMFEYLKHVRQPGMPLMVMEFWTGWFDHWTKKHHVVSNTQFENVLRWILNQDSSVNFYMFHGGTNFGFMNGANEHLGATNDATSLEYTPDVTSYDYDAPVAENGDLTEKYFIIQKILREMFPSEDVPQPPARIESCAYGKVDVNGYMSFSDLLRFVKPIKSKDLLTMEQLPINDDSGQNFGFILYEKELQDAKELLFPGKIKDRATVLLNGKEIETVDWTKTDHVIHLNAQLTELKHLQILVENCGRVNYADFNSPILNSQRKGLRDVHIDGKVVQDWNIYPIEFNGQFLADVSSSDKWTLTNNSPSMPCLCRATLTITGQPADTFVNMTGWTKGVVFINGFNLGRYWNVGPQRTLYVPGPLLKPGDNQLLIFEVHVPADKVTFDPRMDLGEPVLHKTVVPMSARLQLSALKQILKLGGWVWNILRLFIK
jgi:hypothetical protein